MNALEMASGLALRGGSNTPEPLEPKGEDEQCEEEGAVEQAVGAAEATEGEDLFDAAPRPALNQRRTTLQHRPGSTSSVTSAKEGLLSPKNRVGTPLVLGYEPPREGTIRRHVEIMISGLDPNTSSTDPIDSSLDDESSSDFLSAVGSQISLGKCVFVVLPTNFTFFFLNFD